MTQQKSVLISGAGIAGAALAYWLQRSGWRVTVVERAAALRDYGQNVDVRGAGRKVARKMGIEDQIRRAHTGEVGTRFVDERGAAIAEFAAGTGDSDGATAELEILRGQLVRLLHDEGVRLNASYEYGNSITAIDSDDRSASVSFAHGPKRRFDVVVVAEGSRSRTRQLVLGDAVRTRDLGQYVAYGTIQRTVDDDAWWRWCSLVRGRAVMLRPDNVGTTRAVLAFMGPATGLESRPVDEQMAVLRATFGDAGWETPRILDGFAANTSDFYLDRIGQVFASSWSKGRVVMTGDAAYCASSGTGTSFALTGAYVLAGELAKHDDAQAAFASYEQILRPVVERAQKLPPGAPRLLNPTSRVGLALLRSFLRVVASKPAQGLAAKLFAPTVDDFVLPEYEHLFALSSKAA